MEECVIIVLLCCTSKVWLPYSFFGPSCAIRGLCITSTFPVFLAPQFQPWIPGCFLNSQSFMSPLLGCAFCVLAWSKANTRNIWLGAQFFLCVFSWLPLYLIIQYTRQMCDWVRWLAFLFRMWLQNFYRHFSCSLAWYSHYFCHWLEWIYCPLRPWLLAIGVS